MKKLPRAAVFVSGGGTNLQALLDKRGSVIKSGEIVLVVSNKADAFALERAKRAGVEAVYLPCEKGNRRAFELAAEKLLREREIDVIVLAGFMLILSAEFVEKWDHRIINVHPALIPSFCGEGFYGLKVHRAALDYGVKLTGATVHYVNSVADGGEIILQKAVEVLEGDTPEKLQRRVMEQAEWELLPRALELVFQKIAKERNIETVKEEKTMENKLNTLAQQLCGNTYPGRGILIGTNEKGETVIAYFIMGRSENSRNRIFEKTADGIRTRAFDESKCTDPSLIIYAPVRKIGGVTVVTNGDQTDTVRDELVLSAEPEKDYSARFASALARREFEPDPPNFTPRISGILTKEGYELSILKSEDQSGTVCQRNFFKYQYENGVCHLIHTYEHDGSPIPTFRGEPRRLACPDGSAEEIAQYVWSCLDEANRVSLFVRKIAANGENTVIINKHC